jgi:pyrroloquinoline quinone biosynthesis protein B
MRIRVLGSAAGGGFPQWNCACPSCQGVRSGTVRARARMQESVAISSDGEAWFLLNASPEIRAQVESFPPLHPRTGGPRSSPIEGIVLTNGDLDHTLGLLSLRESQPLRLYATSAVERGFREGNVLYRTLERFTGQVTWSRLVPGPEPGAELPLSGVSGYPSGLTVQAVAVPGKVPIHLESRVAAGDPEHNVGLMIHEPASGRRLAYFPAAAQVTPEMLSALETADLVFFDGTFWSSGELVDLHASPRRAEDMAHLPVGGETGSLARLATLRVPPALPKPKRPPRCFYIHLNNTNPLLLEDSPERALAARAGWEVAEDGLEIEL